MVAHPLALQLRNLQTPVELGVDKNTTVVFPAALKAELAQARKELVGNEGPAAAPCRNIDPWRLA